MATLDKIRLSGTTYDLIDSTAVHSLDGYYTSGETNNAITAATSALAESIAEQGYQTSGDVQNAISGKVDNDTYTAYTAATNATLSGKADSSDLANLFGAVAYDSNTQHINFYHESTTGTVLTYVDATPFVKDGFLESVDIEDVELSGETVTCLVFKWNTDAGIQETDIPLSDVFDPSNYMTSADTMSAISAATSGKADSSDVVALSGTVSEMGEVTARALIDLEDNKQDELVNQVNIKSINGTSLLGSGDLQVQTLPTVSGSTLVFS